MYRIYVVKHIAYYNPLLYIYRNFIYQLKQNNMDDQKQFCDMVEDHISIDNVEYLQSLKENILKSHLESPREEYIYQIGYLCKRLHEHFCLQGNTKI